MVGNLPDQKTHYVTETPPMLDAPAIQDTIAAASRNAVAFDATLVGDRLVTVADGRTVDHGPVKCPTAAPMVVAHCLTLAKRRA